LAFLLGGEEVGGENRGGGIQGNSFRGRRGALATSRLHSRPSQSLEESRTQVATASLCRPPRLPGAAEPHQRQGERGKVAIVPSVALHLSRTDRPILRHPMIKQSNPIPPGPGDAAWNPVPVPEVQSLPSFLTLTSLPHCKDRPRAYQDLLSK